MNLLLAGNSWLYLINCAESIGMEAKTVSVEGIIKISDSNNENHLFE